VGAGAAMVLAARHPSKLSVLQVYQPPM